MCVCVCVCVTAVLVIFIHRYLRSVSRPDTSSSLPSRETLLLLIDRFILKIPSSSSSLCGKEKDANMKSKQ